MGNGGISEPGRHEWLYRVMGHFFGHGHDPLLVWYTAHAINNQYCKPPLPPGDVKKLFNDQLRSRNRKRESEEAA
jgi:hypothetical protein